MHRYLQSSGPLFLFKRPVVFGKERKSCLTTFKLPLFQMEQKCLQSEAHSQEQRLQLTPTNPSTRNSIPTPVHHSARGTITHSPRVFCTWKSGQIQRYIRKITKVLTQDVGLGYQIQSLQSWNDLLCSGARQTWGCLAFTGSCTGPFTSELHQTLGPDHAGEITIAIISYDNK